MKRHIVLWLGCLGLSGCQTIGNWADSVGRHMPVIGERCEHWQCITSSGQAESDYNKQIQQRPQNEPKDESQPSPYPDAPHQ